ncbi:hypothetical protein [Devosia sp. CAU 1758]
MRQVLLSIGVSPHHWVQHNLPWLAVLALVFGFDRDDVGAPEQRLDD